METFPTSTQRRLCSLEADTREILMKNTELEAKVQDLQKNIGQYQVKQNKAIKELAQRIKSNNRKTQESGSNFNLFVHQGLQTLEKNLSG